MNILEYNRQYREFKSIIDRSISDNKTTYRDVKNYFKTTLSNKKVPLSNITEIIDSEETITHPFYDNQNGIAIFLEKDWSRKLEGTGLTKEKIISQLQINIEHIKKYSTIEKYDKAKRDLNYNLQNDIIVQGLQKREALFRSIIDSKDQTHNDKFTLLFKEQLKPIEKIFDLFTFEIDTRFISDQTHNPYIFDLTTLIDKNLLLSSTHIDNKFLLDNKIWDMPYLNTPRDYLLESEIDIDIDFLIKNRYITPEYRIMLLLLQDMRNNDTLKIDDKQLDYLLSVYRCCVIGQDKDLDEFAYNSKYYDCMPLFRSTQDCNIPYNDICNIFNDLRWSVDNNALGIELSTSRRLFCPIVIISSDLSNTRYEKIEFESIDNIGVIVFKIRTKSSIIIHTYYIKIKNDSYEGVELAFYDNRNNRIHFSNSASSFPRLQFLESKWAIYKLLWYSSFRKIIPYKKNECDIIVYRINNKSKTGQDIYLLSIYNKDQIRKMYSDFIQSFNDKYDPNSKLRIDMNILIVKLIAEIESYTVISEYRLLNNSTDTKLFIWEINPESVKNEWYASQEITLDKIPCIKSNLFISIDDTLPDDIKMGMNKQNTSIINREKFRTGGTPKEYYKAIDYIQDINGYKTTVDLYKSKVQQFKESQKLVNHGRSIGNDRLTDKQKLKDNTLESIIFKQKLKDNTLKRKVERSEKSQYDDDIFAYKYLKYKDKYIKLKDNLKNKMYKYNEYSN